MRYETEIGCGIGVAECRYRRCQFHHACYGAECCVGEAAGGQHHVFPVLSDAHVYMQTGAGFSGGNLRSEGNVVSVLPCKIAYNPFGHHQLVGSLFCRNRKELDFVLLIYHPVKCEVAYFRMAVFDASSGLGYVCHTPGTEIAELRVRCRLMISALVGGGKHSAVRGNYVIFQFAHGFECHAGGVGESATGFVQSLFGRTFEWLSVFVEERAEHRYRGNFGERVEECCSETRYNV